MTHKPGDKRSEGFPGQRLIIIPPAIVARASRQPVIRDLCVTHIGAFVAAGNHFVRRPNGSPQNILIACLSGNGTCVLNGKEWKLGPGDLLFLPPKQAHLYHADPDSPWTIFWFHFKGMRSEDYLSMLGVSSDMPVVSVDESEVLVDAFEDTFRHTTHGFGEAALTGISTSFARLLGLIKIHQQSSRPAKRRAGNRLIKVLSSLRNDLSRAWTLEELARAANLSVPHFTELCRIQTGMPPLSLLIRLRLQKAMDLLQQGNHNVTEAALAVGYDDPFYFSRLFRKHMGVTPSACRQGP